MRATPAAVAGVALVSALFVLIAQTTGITVGPLLGVDRCLAQANQPTTGWCCVPELYGPDCHPGYSSLDECKQEGLANGTTLYGGSNFEATQAQALCDSPCGKDYPFYYCQNRSDVIDAADGQGPPAAPSCTTAPVPDNGLGKNGAPLPEKGFLEDFNCLQACNYNSPCDCNSCNDADGLGKVCDKTQCEMNPSCVSFYAGNGETGCKPDPADPNNDHLACSSSSSSSSAQGPFFGCCQLAPSPDYGNTYVSYVGAEGDPAQPDALKLPPVNVPAGVTYIYSPWATVQACLQNQRIEIIAENLGDTNNNTLLTQSANALLNKCGPYGSTRPLYPGSSSSSNSLGYIPPYSPSSRSSSSEGLDDLKCPRGIAPETTLDDEGNPEACSIYDPPVDDLSSYTIYVGKWWKLQEDHHLLQDDRYTCNPACELSQTVVKCLTDEFDKCVALDATECYIRNGFAFDFNADGSNDCDALAPVLP